VIEKYDRAAGQHRTPASWADEVLRTLPRQAPAGPLPAWLAGQPVGEPAARGKILAVVAASAGVGKTLIAVHLASRLVAAGGRRVALVDLDLALGTIAAAVGVGSQQNVLTALDALDLEDAGRLLTHLSWARGGFEVLASPGHQPTAPVDPERVGRLLRALAPHYDFVVADTAPTLDGTTLAALDAATMALLVATPEPRGLRSASALVAHLRERRYEPARVKVVLNRARPGVELPPDLPVAWRIPEDQVGAESTIEAAREAPLGRAIAVIVDALGPTAVPPVTSAPVPATGHAEAEPMTGHDAPHYEPPAPAVGPGGGMAASDPAVGRPAAPRVSRRYVVGGAAAFAVLVVGGVGFALASANGARPSPQPTVTPVPASTPPPEPTLPAAPAATAPPAPGEARAPSPAVPTVQPTQPPAPTAPPPAQPTTAPPPTATGVPARQPTAAPRLILDESFGAGARGWPNNPRSTAWAAGGAYHLAARRPGQFVAITAAAGDNLGDVAVTATYRKTGGPDGGGYGIVLRAQQPLDGLAQGGRYYVLEVGDRGEIGAWRRENDRWVDLLTWTHSDVVRPGDGTNKLTALALGSRLTLMVNDQVVANLEDTELKEGRVGIFVGGDGNEVTLERFQVQAAS
jgi:MinD-like ATPase involved in chromosome partitioning or flagellar assembly